jgi:hypothetical protein
MANPNYSYGENSRKNYSRGSNTYHNYHLHMHVKVAPPTRPREPKPVHSVWSDLAERNKALKRLFMIGFIAIAQSFLTVHIIGIAGLFLGATVFAWCLYRFFRLISLRTRRITIASPAAPSLVLQTTIEGGNRRTAICNATMPRQLSVTRWLSAPFLRLPQPLKRLAAPLKRLPRPLKRLPRP